MSVLIVTSLGDLVVDLHTNKCPLTCKNFLKLCKVKYYNGCLFHTVQKDFTAQTGDPTGTGTGGDSVYKFLYGDQARFFSDEIHIDLKHSKTGTVAMASAGENLNASQFYITLRDDLDYLDGKHTVFGEVAEGFETLTRINEAYVDEKGRPYKNIRIKHTYILEDPYDDPSQLSEFIPEASPEKPKDEVDDEVRLEDDWVPMDEQLNPAELVEVIRSKEAHSRAVVLESIGDIPDAEIKPPDNVLFVCKLNPVTEDEDLHTIFSRFGTVSSAEIIRDHKTGDSLCYAFIEFEDKRSCEQAYFKMDNALIDDRRIHVDFSQSVAKLWSQYRRKDQKGKGGGCFKCGSTDHIAKDCTGDATMQQPQAKYILKDDNAQRGGENARYEMVFDGDNSQSPRRDIKHQRHDGDDPVVRKGGKENFKDHRSRRDQDMVDSNNRDRYGDRNRGHGGNGDNKARSERGARDLDYHADKKDRDRHMGRRGDDDYKRKDERDSRKRDQDDDYKRKDERDSRKRDEDDSYKQKDERELRKRDEDDGHKRKDERELRKRDEDDGHKRKDERESRKRDEDDSYKQKDERDSRKRDEDDNYRERRTSRDDRRNTDSSHLEGRNDRDYRKRPEGSGKQDMKIDSGRSKRSLGDEDYKNGRDDEDYRNKREEHGHKRQDIEADDDYKRRREDANYKRRREDGDCRHRREERGHKRPDIESDDYPHRRRHGDRR